MRIKEISGCGYLRRLCLVDQNSLGGFGPDKGFGAGIVFGEISVDGGLQVGDRVEDAPADALPGHLGKKFSTALSQEAEVGVKWNLQRG